MMVQQTAALVKKYGRCDAPPCGRQRGVYSVVCQGCGKKIDTTYGGSVDYAVTKRGTAMFWHTECFDKVPANKILWRERNEQLTVK